MADFAARASVEVEGEGFVLEGPRSRVEIGRSRYADVQIGGASDDLHVSRVVAVLRSSPIGAELTNASDKMTIKVELDGGTLVTLRPGSASLPVPSGSSGVIWLKGRTDYTVSFKVRGEEPAGPTLPSGRPDEEPTVGWVEGLDITEDELDVLTAMAAHRLNDPMLPETAVATRGEVAALLGRSPRWVDNRTDSLAVKLEPYLLGLVGDNAGRANTRRYRLVAFALDTGVVTMSRLRRLSQRPQSADPSGGIAGPGLGAADI